MEARLKGGEKKEGVTRSWVMKMTWGIKGERMGGRGKNKEERSEIKGKRNERQGKDQVRRLDVEARTGWKAGRSAGGGQEATVTKGSKKTHEGKQNKRAKGRPRGIRNGQ